jgi:predicted dehydrogenase
MVKWGIIGVGNVTEKKSGPAFQKVEGSELVAVMRRTGHLAKDYAERHGIQNGLMMPKARLMTDVDAIYIATPPTVTKNTRLWRQRQKTVYVENRWFEISPNANA